MRSCSCGPGNLACRPHSCRCCGVAFHVVKSGGNLLAGHAVDKLGPRPLILSGWLLYTAIYLAFALASSAWHVWVVFLGYGLVYALTEPAEKTLVANLVRAERRGLAFGWFNCVIGIAVLPSSLIFGWLYERYGGSVAFGWGSGLAPLAAVFLLGVGTIPNEQKLPEIVTDE